MTTTDFLSLFGDGQFTFQTFDDSSAKSPKLSRVLHGTLHKHTQTLNALNDRGAGVFFMVNKGDGKGRRAKNVQKVTALFLDLDGSPLKPVQAAGLSPHCTVESSPGRWHAYWLVADCPLDRFTSLQQALADRFQGDKKVCDLPRVMRLPGFYHRKAARFMSRILTLDANRAPYKVAELVRELELKPAPAPPPLAKQRKLPGFIPEGERNTTLLSLGAGLVRKGHDLQGVNVRLQVINSERCRPPLGATEVERIAARAHSYGSNGFVQLPHQLLDSLEWKALPPPAHDIVLMAFRRFDGSNNGNIALTWSDFADRPGFSDKKTFYRHRRRALASKILIARQAGNGRNGRTPDLIAIADHWLPGPVCKSQPGPSTQISDLYIDKQSVGTCDSKIAPEAAR
ncbi:MAG: primase C-terminal domain-containing protein [Rhizobium sp.]|nr:primase C-terminal domain-containing protein [Rhizobium sp.]